MTNAVSQDIDHLNKFLRGERAATETYQQCIEKIDDSALEQELRTLASSHHTRVRKLEAMLTQLGAEADDSSGVWGSFAKLVEGGAALFGKSAAISALEEGEDHGLAMYKDNLDELSSKTLFFVRNELLPEQQRTHDALSRIEARV